MDINAVQSALDVTNYSDHDAMVYRVNYTGTFTGMACFQRDGVTRARGARGPAIARWKPTQVLCKDLAGVKEVVPRRERQSAGSAARRRRGSST